MRTSLVTGGSRGIGRAIVQHLSQSGWRVVFSYCHSRDAALSLARQTGAYAIRADLRHEDQAQTLADQAISILGHLDTAVFNAGISMNGLLQDMSTAQWDEVFSVNLRGAFLTIRPVVSHMVSRGTGSLLLISSMWGLRGASCEAAYAASKAGLIGLSSSLAQELGPCGIRVNSIAPGVIATDMLSEYSAEERDALAGRCLLKRIGRPEEVAKAAAFLLDHEASYITGQTLSVDGGFI